MDFTQKSFDLLIERNSELEYKIKSLTEFSEISRLNESQFISLIGSWKWDVKNNEVYWSDMMFTVLGLEPNQMIPSYELALHYVHPDDKKHYENSLLDSLNNKTDYYLENRILRDDNSIIDVISKGICITDDSGNLVSMSGTVQDITYLKQLLNTNKQLEHFADILSHDFKSPIRTIINFIGLIKIKSFDNLTHQGKEYFSYVENGARKLTTLVDDILEYSKLSSHIIVTSIVPIGDIVSPVLIDLSASIDDNHALVSVGWLPETIKVDRLKIRRVFQNLISNAIKFVPKDVQPKIEIYCEETEEEYVFHVKDNGVGLSQEHERIVFEPYTRVQNEQSFSGSGIGLSICKQIVELHKGTIGYRTNSNSGSCFYFSIPK